jgi:hypothetical protein
LNAVLHSCTDFPREACAAVALVAALLAPAAVLGAEEEQSAVTITACSFAVLGSVFHGGEAMLDVRFVDRDSRNAVSITFEASYASTRDAPTVAFLDEGQFQSGMAIRHTLRKRLISRLKPTYWNDRARCRTARVRYADGSSWEPSRSEPTSTSL